MGFIKENDEIKIVTKLTPYGRSQILGNSNTNVIKYFSLGDSEANYMSPVESENGEIMTHGGNINGQLTMTSDYEIKNKIQVDSLGNFKKSVEANSNEINTTKKVLGQKTVDSTKITQYKVNRTSYSDTKINWLLGLGLPVTENDKTSFDELTNSGGGYFDTALKTLSNDENLILSLDVDEFGELIDGKTIKLALKDDNAVNYNIYGTYQRSLTPKETHDTKPKEISTKADSISNNIIFLFSDEIQKPNGEAGKTWGTGYAKNRPFSVNGKELFNLVDNPNNSQNMDECVGVAYLDKGIIVITHPTIIENYTVTGLNSGDIALTFNSISTQISQDVTCIINRGEFINSTNKTYNGEDIRISEVGIYDNKNNLIALGKPNKHLIVGVNDFKAIGIKISV